MSALAQIRQGLRCAGTALPKAGTNCVIGPSNALTHFFPGHRKDVETAEERLKHSGSGWGLLATEVCKRGDELVLRMAAPGMGYDKFDIPIAESRVLVARGEKRVRREERRGQFV